MLIGAELFWILLKSDKIVCGKNKPILQNTELGWIISGRIGESRVISDTSCNLSTNQDLCQALSKFWEIEEGDVAKPMSQEELECEKIFVKTTRRDTNGRFIVSLPLRQPPECLGKSREQAEKMFYSTERRLSKNESLRKLYTEFLSEYEELNHMSLVDNDSENIKVEFFMPHHGVLRDDSLTTRLRVVFNASFPTSNGISLNSIQYVGPVLQDDLWSIILRFRQHKYVISADCAKMYRQVLIEPKHRNLQKILWRCSPDETLKTYTLNTLTYGHASASYLAIRCFFELANECQESAPEIAEIIRRDFYVDDMLTGADCLEHAQNICREVSEVLKGGCFELRKWYSNEPKVLKFVENKEAPCGVLEFGPDENAKTLGLTWNCQKDELVYALQSIENPNSKCTKRMILSLTARIFDPLGLLSPVVIIAKMLMQCLWFQKLGWDDILPNHLSEKWYKLVRDLPNLKVLSIKRRVVCSNAQKIELHGFCDASERAYGACAYVRSIDNSGKAHVYLLAAKSKVAPIKTVSIPRLELCGALILSRLIDKIRKSMNIKFDDCVLWSDSAVCLAWINTSPNLLKIFIANRVAEIQNITKEHQWRYVPTRDNPADLVSRGLYPSEILNSRIWWHGPTWLELEKHEWPVSEPNISVLPELKSQSVLSVPTCAENSFPFNRFSSFSRLIRCVAYILRFKENCKTAKVHRTIGVLTKHEISKARNTLIKTAQLQTFSKEIASLTQNRKLDTRSKLLSLAPFLDSEQIIRVGGRLKLSDFSIDKKHPIVLDSSHQFTKLIFIHEHLKHMHVGPHNLLAFIREEFWPLGGRNLARATVKNCVRCTRFRADNIQPMMGNLPRDRVVPSPPFNCTGIDYAGPFLVRQGLTRGRGGKLEKCYIGLFICFSTKAVHLELISSLSTESFIQAFRRFVSRRGRPVKLVSDNGKNFIGAQRELGKFLSSNKESLMSFSAGQGIDWQFIPPYSPHMGGLWESNIKCVKSHLKHVLFNAHLSFEEFSTILCQIEAILNSRPLCPLTSDPNDLCSLTPAHFLIGRSLIAAPDEALNGVKINRLTRYQRVQELSQHFWQRWKRDYIVELQQRQKWKASRGQLTKDMLVLIKDDQTLPTEWKLGRIIHLHEGQDGIARVASIRTSTGVVRRNFQKICPLPVEV